MPVFQYLVLASNKEHIILSIGVSVRAGTIGDQWIPMTKAQLCGMGFNAMMSSWFYNLLNDENLSEQWTDCDTDQFSQFISNSYLTWDREEQGTFCLITKSNCWPLSDVDGVICDLAIVCEPFISEDELLLSAVGTNGGYTHQRLIEVAENRAASDGVNTLHLSQCCDVDALWKEDCWLTHWPLGDLDVILKLQFSISFDWLVSSHRLRLMPRDECQGTSPMINQHWFR